MSAAFTDATAIAAELQRRLMAREPYALERTGIYLPILPRVHCADGFNVSIQADHHKYCTPRDNTGPWWEVELGFPSAPMPELADRCDSWNDDAETVTKTVWGYVPMERVAAVLASHGGLLPKKEAA
jgi:hypothetical protein